MCSIKEDFRGPAESSKGTERETAYEIGYRVALDTVMQEIRPGIDWGKRVEEYRNTGEIHVEY